MEQRRTRSHPDRRAQCNEFGYALLIAVVALYGRHRWPAYVMLVVWPIGFVLA